MIEQSEATRKLLAAARAARPAAMTRNRVDLALATRIGPAAIGLGVNTPSGAPSPVATAPSSGAPALGASPGAGVGVVGTMSFAKLAALGVLLVAVPVLGIAALRHRAPSRTEAMARRAPMSEPAPLAAPPAIPLPSPVVAPSPPQDGPAPTPTAPVRSSVSPRRAPSLVVKTGAAARPESSGRAPSEVSSSQGISVEEETAILGEVQRSLSQGRGSHALDLLDGLAARHPSGDLREERLAAHVFAQCASGHVDEAREEAQRFLREMPTSVQATRVRASCAFADDHPADRPSAIRDKSP